MYCRYMMLEYYICFIASFQILNFIPCLIDACDKGFYGPNCNFTCNANCKHGMCAVSMERGLGLCMRGCKPGFYGSSCQLNCQEPSADTFCQKCPEECIDGFCDNGKRCFSGCVNDFYGYNCTRDRAEGYHPGYGEDSPNSTFTVYYYVAGGVGVLVLVSILGLVIYLSHRMKRVDTILSHSAGCSRGNELEATEPQVTVSTPCTASLTDSLYTTVVKEMRREVIPVRCDSIMENCMDAYNAVNEYDDEVGTYNKLMWNAYR